MSAKRYTVVCSDYSVECRTREAAERAQASIERAGNCRNEHHIEGPDEEAISGLSQRELWAVR